MTIIILHILYSILAMHLILPCVRKINIKMMNICELAVCTAIYVLALPELLGF